MSVALFRIDGNDIYNHDAKITLSESIASEAFYQKYWEKAIQELGIKIFQDGSQFSNSDLDAVLSELTLLKNWADKNLKGKDQEYMKSHIEQLLKIIPGAFSDDDTILYIF